MKWFFFLSLRAVFDERITSFNSLSERGAPQQQQQQQKNLRKCQKRNKTHSRTLCATVWLSATYSPLTIPILQHLSHFCFFVSDFISDRSHWPSKHAYVTSAPHRISVIDHNFTFIVSYRTQQPFSAVYTWNIVVAPITIETKFRCVYAIRTQRNSALLFCWIVFFFCCCSADFSQSPQMKINLLDTQQKSESYWNEPPITIETIKFAKSSIEHTRELIQKKTKKSHTFSREQCG